jgi:hypothetical protein
MGNALPVFFVLWVTGTVWYLHFNYHLMPLINSSISQVVYRGMVQLGISQTLTTLLLICFARAVFTDPGVVPSKFEWQAEYRQPKIVSWSSWSHRGSGVSSQDPESGHVIEEPSLPTTREVKHTGERRFCKWCDTFKPDRTHHCRVCKSCTLRMDHHCPWIANCVGFRNHKFFFLLVFYALVNCWFIVITMWETLQRTIDEEVAPRNRFLVVFGLTLSVMMGVLLKTFLSFHVWLMLKATTTIEFCEKRHRRSSPSQQPEYDRGLYENLKAVLGPIPLLWLLPCCPPAGDGVNFPVKGQDEVVDETSALLGLSKRAAAKAAAATSSVDRGSEAPEVTGGKAASM